jgi:hypothetical protein
VMYQREFSSPLLRELVAGRESAKIASE